MENVDRYKCLVYIQDLEIQGVEEQASTGDPVLERIYAQQRQEEQHRLYLMDVRSIIGFDIIADDTGSVKSATAYCAEGITITIDPDELTPLTQKWTTVTKRWY